MKRILLLIFLTSFFSESQTLIKEGNFDKNNRPVDYNYLSKTDEIAISYGTAYKLSTNFKITKILSFNKEAQEHVFYSGDGIMDPIWSISGNSLQASKFSAVTTGKKYLYVVNGKPTEFRKYSDLNKNYFTSYIRFNDDYRFGFVNQNGKMNIDLEKDELFLEKRSLKTDKITKVKLEKPLASEVIGEGFLKPNESKIFFKTRILNNDNIEIVTKAISKDYNTCTIFRRVYDSNGNLIDRTPFMVNLDHGYFAYSNTRGDYFGYSTHSVINNFIVDEETKEVYVYGLFGQKAKGYGSSNKVSGYYIHKFSKNGDLIYKVQTGVKDDDGLNKKLPWNSINCGMVLEKGKILFIINKVPTLTTYTDIQRGKTTNMINKANLFTHRFELDPETGKNSQENNALQATKLA